MLNIYYGRESLNKEQFIFERIGKANKPCLVIVPDQYTLEGEKQAIKFLDTSCLLNVEVISMSRLGSRILSKTGGQPAEFLDKYGRHMLLVSIMKELEGELEVFGTASLKPDFLELTNNLISQFKQYDVTPEDLLQLAENLENNDLLTGKLKDFYKIFSLYEKKIAGKFTDSEDLIELYLGKILEWDYLEGKDVWIYGFDSFAPKAVRILGNLMKKAENLNVFLTFDDKRGDRDLFVLTGIVRNSLIEAARTQDISWNIEEVSDERYIIRKSKGISRLEQGLYSVTRKPAANSDGITLLKAANPYSEAQSAAAYIMKLVRDKGLRFRDIVVICNDQQTRASIIRRTFEEWGISIFDDKKRSLMNHPVAILIIAMLETVINNYPKDSLFKALKTGLFDVPAEDIEELENYGIKYRIRGSMWKKDFVKGELEYGIEGFEHIKEIRKSVIEPFQRLEEICKAAEDTDEFVRQFYQYLTEEMKLAEKISLIIEKQEELELYDLADETAQVWNAVAGLMEQIHQLCRGESFDAPQFVELLIAGLSQLEVGVIPQSSDQILMGTMQRTRVGSVKAVLVIGANEGLIPQDNSNAGIFADDELALLSSENKELCKIEDVRVMEEKLAIYRNLSKPSEYLWISFAAGDQDGKELRPSELIDNIRRLFSGLEIEADIITKGNAVEFIGGATNTICQLSEALQHARKGEKISPLWKAVIVWLEKNEPEKMNKLKNSLSFDNEPPALSESLVNSLYKKDEARDFSISPSRLERFSRCPFSHFVTYGLKPSERRSFEASAREIGDVYHECLMKIAERLTAGNLWESITEQQCKAMIDEILTESMGNYREGVFDYTGEDRYKAGRIKDTVFQVCWALIEQVNAGEIEKSVYETCFGRGADIKPVEVCLGNQTVYIEGIIDRVDYLKDDMVKIIDYKTGNEHFSVDEARGGYRLQLMLYLKAAQENIRKPAGVFYFLISEKTINTTDVSYEKMAEKISAEVRKEFRLDGVMIDKEDVVRAIAGEFDGYSDIVSINRKKDGTVTGSPLLSEEEFDRLQQEVDGVIRNLCRDLIGGNISITPKKTDKTSPCVYCRFKGICRFDTEFKGCNYVII